MDCGCQYDLITPPDRSFKWFMRSQPAVVYRHLTPPVRGKVDQLLAGDDDTLTAPDMATRATWADKFRDSDRHTSQRHYRLTREWHFVDIELDELDFTAACFGHPAAAVPASQGPAKACAVDRIAVFAT